MYKFEFAKKMILGIGLFSIMLHLLSCTKEDLVDCDLFLQFRYDYNLANEDWFAEQVEEVKVFLFDKEGRYVETLSETTPTVSLPNYKMKISDKMKGYTAIVWAGRTGSYQLPTLQVGDTKEKLILQYVPLNMKSDKTIDNLWHSGPIELSFPDNGGTTQTANLVRNTNDFSIRLLNGRGESVLATHALKITSANGSYDHKNLFLSDNHPIDYVPHTITAAEAQLRTLRLLTGDNVTLSVTNDRGIPVSIGGKTEINLIEYLLLNKPSGMTDQEYLDRCYIWNLSLTVRDSLVLSITINGWVVWFNTTEV